MTEIMVRSSVGENFSYAKPGLEQIQSRKDSSMLIGDDLEDESTLSFNSKLDTVGDKSSESTICGSITDDSVVSGVQSTMNSTDMAVDTQVSADNTIKSDASCEDYEYLTAETTVINTTYNMISQSEVHDVKKVSSDQPSTSSQSIGNDSVDKSKVIVQILRSDTKDSTMSQAIHENKSASENQSTHSFRDDVFKILSKPQSSFDFGANTKQKANLNAFNVCERVQIKSSTKIYKTKRRRTVSPYLMHDNGKKNGDIREEIYKTKGRRKVNPYLMHDNGKKNGDIRKEIYKTKRRRTLSPYFMSENGKKIGDIREVAIYLKAATTSALRILHFLLYDKYGLCGSDFQIETTRKRISRFSGFPFDGKSVCYEKKLNSMSKLPIELLREMYEAVFGRTLYLGRFRMVHNFMKFLCNTETYYDIINQAKYDLKYVSESEYAVLKERAKSGPFLVVILQKLNEGDMNKLLHELKMDVEEKAKLPTQSEALTKYKTIKQSFDDVAPFILNGSGQKLKCFPSIIKNVENATEKEINLLHFLLYGRFDSIDKCRKNILEFSGFLNYQTSFIAEVEHLLKRLTPTDMLRLCNLLCLRAKTHSKLIRIKKIMDFLKAPSNPLKIKGCRRKVTVSRVSSQPKPLPGESNKIKKNNSSKCKKKISIVWMNETSASLFGTLENSSKRNSNVLTAETNNISPGVSMPPAQSWEEPESAEYNDGGYRLRDFAKICRNIACSVPADLTELNDLLFMKPSDDTEIHDRILDFTRFGFSESSIHYHYRKTLMFYMGSCIVRKIAALLDIENWEMISSYEDLSVCILKFLMKSKHPNFIPAPSIVSQSPDNNIPFQVPPITYPSEVPQVPFPSEVHQVTYPSEVPQVTYPLEDVMEFADHTTVSPPTKVTNAEDYSWNQNDGVCETVELTRGKDFVSSSTSYRGDDSVPLRDFIHHPTERELNEVIRTIVPENTFNGTTLGDVVKQVYGLYPQFNLTYREDFIKSAAREILSEMREEAFHKVIGFGQGYST